MQKFELVLKNERIKAYKTFIHKLFFIALNIIFFIVLAITDSDTRGWSSWVVAMTIFSFILEYYLRKKKKLYSGKGVSLFYFILAYLLLHYWWMALAVLIVAILYSVSLRPLIVYINPDNKLFTLLFLKKPSAGMI